MRGYLDARCPWETAIGLAGVQRAEDARWRDAVEAAEEQGAEVPAAEAEWAALHLRSRMTIAEVAGALVVRALSTGGKDAVAPFARRHQGDSATHVISPGAAGHFACFVLGR